MSVGVLCLALENLGTRCGLARRLGVTKIFILHKNVLSQPLLQRSYRRVFGRSFVHFHLGIDLVIARSIGIMIGKVFDTWQLC